LAAVAEFPLSMGGKMLRTVFAVILGAIVGMLTIMAMEFLFSLILPVPAALDLSQPGASATYMANIPLANKIAVLFGWAAASFAAGHTATRMARASDVRPAVAAGSILVFAGILNMVLLPHPWWMWLAGIVLLLAPAYLAARRLVSGEGDLREA
jgi:hypothetical protein